MTILRTLLLSTLAAAALFAQPQTVTCDDGRVMAISPFNPNPCPVNAPPVEEQVEVQAEAMPDAFLAVYGPPPAPTGNSLKDRVARVKYEQDMKYFAGLVEAPGGFEKVASFYDRWGLGAPVFYQGRYGTYCRWPNAPFLPMQANMFAAVNGAGVVLASWQAKVILEGHVLSDVHSFVPPWVRKINEERLQALRDK